MVRGRLLLACVLTFAAVGERSHAAAQQGSRQHGATARRLQQAAAPGNGTKNQTTVMSVLSWPLPSGYL